MKALSLSLSVFVASLPSLAFASDFRFCDMEGTVQKADLHVGNKARVFDLVVLVSSSHVEKGEFGKMGYTDCSEFVGKNVEIRLQIPAMYGKLANGDFVSFNYSAVDGFGPGGKYVGTSISAVLHNYQKSPAAAGR
jgi:hypothetical protein